MSQASIHSFIKKRQDVRLDRLLRAVENLDHVVRMFVSDLPNDEKPKVIRRENLFEIDFR